MYAIHKQVHPPTGVELSLYCNFLSATEKNLVIAGVNQLHVYRLNANIEVSAKSNYSNHFFLSSQEEKTTVKY